MSKFVDNLVFVAVTVVVFTLDDDGRVRDCLPRGVLIIDADNLVGLPFTSLKLCVSFTLRLLAWFGVFLAISKNQPREKGMFFLLRKIFCNQSEKRQESGAQNLNA